MAAPAPDEAEGRGGGTPASSGAAVPPKRLRGDEGTPKSQPTHRIIRRRIIIRYSEDNHRMIMMMMTAPKKMVLMMMLVLHILS